MEEYWRYRPGAYLGAGAESGEKCRMPGLKYKMPKKRGQSVERSWKKHGKSVVRTQKERGKSVERAWKERGNYGEIAWKECGKSVERA